MFDFLDLGYPTEYNITSATHLPMISVYYYVLVPHNCYLFFNWRSYKLCLLIGFCGQGNNEHDWAGTCGVGCQVPLAHAKEFYTWVDLLLAFWEILLIFWVMNFYSQQQHTKVLLSPHLYQYLLLTVLF